MDSTDNIEQVAQIVLNAVQSGNYRALAAGLLVLIIAAFRWVAPKLDGRLGALVKSDRGGAALAILAGLGGALTTALLAKQAINVQLLVSGVVTGVLAAGGFNVVKKLFAPSDKQTPPVEGMKPLPEAPKSGESGFVSVSLLLWLASAVLFAFAMSGCGGMITYYRSVSTTAVMGVTGYKALNEVDKQKQTLIVKTAGSDAIKAKAMLDEYLPKYDAARKALDVGATLVQDAQAAAPLVEAGINKDKDIASWVAKLTTAAVEIGASLSALGVKLPSLGGK